MAESCDDDPSNYRIMGAFRKNFHELTIAMKPCVMEVAGVLYREGLIPKDTITRAAFGHVSTSELLLRRSFKVVDAVEVYMKVFNSSSKSLEILSILEKHPPLNIVVDNILQDAGLRSRSSSSNGKFHSHSQNHVLVQ